MICNRFACCVCVCAFHRCNHHLSAAIMLAATLNRIESNQIKLYPSAGMHDSWQSMFTPPAKKKKQIKLPELNGLAWKAPLLDHTSLARSFIPFVRCAQFVFSSLHWFMVQLVQRHDYQIASIILIAFKRNQLHTKSIIIIQINCAHWELSGAFSRFSSVCSEFFFSSFL